MSGRGRPRAGTIAQRGPFQFQARITHEGKRKARTFDTELKAQQWLDGLNKAEAKGRARRAVEARAMTLKDALERRLRMKGHLKSLKSETGKTNRLIMVHGWLTSMPIYNVDEIDIQDFIEKRIAEGVGNATVNRDLAVISNTFNLARTKMGCTGLINPIVPTTRQREPRGRVRRLPDDEHRILLKHAAIKADSGDTPIGPIIEFASETAMRISEIAGMDWRDVNIAEGTVFIGDTKNNDRRIVALTLKARALLRQLGVQESGLVWGKLEAIRSAWRRVRDAAIDEAEQTQPVNPAFAETLAERLRDLRFHDLRHEGTSSLIEKTCWPNSKIKAITGHRTDAMLARYSHLRGGALARELAELDGGAPEQSDDSDDWGASVASPASPSLRQQWRAISHNACALRALVWSQPIVRVAAEFGVSDAAVHKACKAQGVEKPPPGHWQQRVKS